MIPIWLNRDIGVEQSKILIKYLSLSVYAYMNRKNILKDSLTLVDYEATKNNWKKQKQLK